MGDKKMYKNIYIKSIILPLTLILLGSGCSNTMPKFDQNAYEKSVSLKVDSLSLIAKSTKPYKTYQNEIDNLTLRIEKAYEYAKGKPNNEIITKQWEIIKNPNAHQIGGYLKRWKEKNQLSKAFIEEAQKTIAKGFDQVIGLESGLIKAKDKK